MAYSKITLYKKNKDKKRFIIIYFRHDGSPFRHRTGVVVDQKNFDSKFQRIKPSDVDFKSKNEIILDAHKLVEEIINDFIKENGFKPSSKFVKSQIQSGIKLRKGKVEADILECYSDFLNEKKIQFSGPERSYTSLRDYVSTYNALNDYAKVIGPIQPVQLNNQLWLDQFNKFLAIERPKIKGYKFTTSKQNDKTRAKRFGILKNLGKWLKQNGFLKDFDTLNDYKVKVEPKTYYTLGLDELRTIQSHKFETKSQQKAIDLFIIACHTGVRFSDAIRIRKSRIRTPNDLHILTLNSQKTKVKMKIPLTLKVVSLLEKYDYNMNFMSSQKINMFLHDALGTIGHFKEEFEFGLEGETKPIYELITFHTGRRTFITNLVNNSVNLNAIMKMTGHKKISTLQSYINPDYELMMDNVKIFNEL